jgi:hypothetical protein
MGFGLTGHVIKGHINQDPNDVFIDKETFRGHGLLDKGTQGQTT